MRSNDCKRCGSGFMNFANLEICCLLNVRKKCGTASLNLYGVESEIKKIMQGAQIQNWWQIWAKKRVWAIFVVTFTKEGDKISNANKMIYRVFVRSTKYKANRLICFVRVRFSVAAVPQKRGQVSVCFCSVGETCYSGVASGKNGRVHFFLYKARSSQYS